MADGLDFELTGVAGLLSTLQRAGDDAPRAAGAANGRFADKVRDDVQQTFARRGWGATSDVRARRGSGGPHDPTAYVFVKGGAAFQESGTSTQPPNPSLRPAVDRFLGELDGEIADEVEKLL